MNKFQGLLIGTIGGLALTAQATTIGVSSHPFAMKNQVVTTEFTGYMSNGTGMGLTARYFNRVNEDINLDIGVGVTDGERANRAFLGADFQIFPDYGDQPRISLKAMGETADEFSTRYNSLGVAPTISKGFSIDGHEVFPFVALPMRVAMDAEDGTYETQTALALGATGRLPFEGMDNMVGNIEANVGLRNSFSSIVLGISLPIL
jgi:hypothetical protein